MSSDASSNIVLFINVFILTVFSLLYCTHQPQCMQQVRNFRTNTLLHCCVGPGRWKEQSLWQPNGIQCKRIIFGIFQFSKVIFRIVLLQKKMCWCCIECTKKKVLNNWYAIMRWIGKWSTVNTAPFWSYSLSYNSFDTFF